MSEIIEINNNRELHLENLVNMEEYWRLRLQVAKMALKYATEQYDGALSRLENFRDQEPLF